MKTKLIYSLFGAVALASCSNNEELAATSSGGSEPITVAAAVDGQSIVSRAQYNLTTPTADDPLAADVWVSTTSHSYPGAGTGAGDEAPTVLDVHDGAKFSGGSKQMLETAVYYPTPDTKSVYLVGLAPKGWTAESDGGTSNVASFTFTGKEDVMCTPEASGTGATSKNSPTLNFNHLLTCLRIYEYADKAATAESWGDITTLTVDSKNKVSVKTDDNTATFSQSGSSTFLYCYLSGTDEQLNEQTTEITLEKKEIAYVMCEPVNATAGDDEYTLNLTTTENGTVLVPVNLTSSEGVDFTGSTAGHVFDIVLKFADNNTVRPTTVVSADWSSMGVAITSVAGE